jgi:hypothetical protein
VTLYGYLTASSHWLARRGTAKCLESTSEVAGRLPQTNVLGVYVTIRTIPEITSKRNSFARSGLPFVILCASVYSLSFAQQSAQEDPTPSDTRVPQPVPLESKRIFGVIPNNRTSPSLTDYRPLSTKEKFEIARQDSFDRGTVVLAAAFAGDAQLTNANPSFGQGIKGYSRNFGAAFGDLVIGNYLSEAVYPALLHQDPRYFRRGNGSGWSRLRYSVGQIFWTHTDSNRTQFNYSEILGNSTAVAISNAYYPDNRDAIGAGAKFGMQIGVDMASNILKEFWPDVIRRFSRRDRQ